MPVWASDSEINFDYQPGKGLQIPGTGLNFGGYADFGIQNDRQHPTSISINNLSIFLHWDNDGKVRVFSELDLENALAWESANGVTTNHAYLGLERLYADYLYSEKLNLRAGKFLTPIGRWNVIHAAPLVWTTSRPLVTERSFPTNATGGMAYGTIPIWNSAIDYSIYAAMTQDWRSDPKLDPFEEAYGFHLTLPTSHLGEIGVSYANFEQKSSIGDRKNLVGIDYFWSKNRYEISSEGVYRRSENAAYRDTKGIFIQGVAPISQSWYGIGRYEFYDNGDPGAAMNLWLGGVAKRVSPAMIFKAEFSHADNNRIKAPEGFFTSLAILF
ncbi:hypothetical protein SFSGTM_11310 [Sulfuriferula nivalis]|uniref:Porin n=2 Tax=Sulfuriferula nivalis TaxID=2675298 RepID=A0A809S8C5_9PROT|nr:hypothetical protein SFSGTM_11310 [Sulfuriferula nivalis]